MEMSFPSHISTGAEVDKAKSLSPLSWWTVADKRVDSTSLIVKVNRMFTFCRQDCEAPFAYSFFAVL